MNLTAALSSSSPPSSSSAAAAPDSQSVLPVGLSDNPRVSTVNVYCPKCQDIFVPRSMRQVGSITPSHPPQ